MGSLPRGAQLRLHLGAPLLTSLVAGDVFAAEDRLGTWRHLVMAVRSPRRIFVAKALASTAVILAMEVGLAVSSIGGGLAAVGNRDLVGLDGQLIDTGQSARLVLLAWACTVVASLAFAAVGLLGSVALGRSPMGLLVPAVLAFVLQAVQLLPLPAVVRLALPSQGFLAWRGLFSDPTQTRPVLIGLVVSSAWVLVATALAYLLFVRRDFTDVAYDGSGRRSVVVGVLPVAALAAVSVAVVAVATPASGSGIDRARIESSLATSFAHLYRLQSRELAPPGRDRGAAAHQRVLLPGRVARRRRGSRQRLAVCRVVAHPRSHGRRDGPLPAGRRRRRALRRRR